MTTFISLAASATMFPSDGTIRTSALTNSGVKARMERVQVVSALNPSHATTIDAIRRRFDLELPLPPPGPAPKVALQPGDELFIAQATLPRLKEGDVHSQATVDAAPISFVRWRVPVCVNVRPPADVSQAVFNEIIDDAYAIALWQRGEDHLQDIDVLQGKFDGEAAELKAVVEKREALREDDENREFLEHFLDSYLEGADIFYYALCHWYVTVTQYPELCEYGHPMHGHEIFWKAMGTLKRSILSEHTALDIALAKYARRAAGHPKDIEAERRLAAPFIPRTEALYR